jgi:hypothetical protein
LLFFSCDFFDNLLNGNNTENNNNGNDNPKTGIVEPLLQTNWSQGAPYNIRLREMATEVGDILNVTSGICGIVAWAQLMRYHRHPTRGIGQSEPWTHSNGVNFPSVNFEVDFDWDNMLYTYTSSATEQQRNAVAELYYIISIGRADRLPETVNNLGYDRSIRRLERLYYNDDTWKSILKAQLDAGLPVYYWGTGNGNHGFIVDGYDKEDRFHINWGWGGSHNGYYSLNALTPGNYNFNNSQRMVINFKPDQGGVFAGYEMAILSFTSNKTSVHRNESFVIREEMRNTSNFDSFPGGQIGAALVDNNGNIVEIIGTRNSGSLTAGNRYGSPRVLNCFVPLTVEPGEYNVRIVTQTTGSENWRIVELSAIGNGIPNTIALSVYPCESITPTGGYGQMLLEFATDRLMAVHNETTQFTITLEMRNTTSERFSGGQYAAALLDDAGNIVSILGIRDSLSLGAGNRHGSSLAINCTVTNNTVAPGQYLLRILVSPNTTGGEWRIATLSNADIPTSYAFTVQ